jgi:hypothetical protein
MTTFISTRTFGAALLGLSLISAITPALADVSDYEFQLVQNEIKKGDAVVAARLINKKSGALVPDAVIFAARLDMAPDGMEAMKTTIEPIHSVESGVYRFKATVTMEGNWRLSLQAKVQGETGTVESKLVIRVQE